MLVDDEIDQKRSATQTGLHGCEPALMACVLVAALAVALATDSSWRSELLEPQLDPLAPEKAMPDPLVMWMPQVPPGSGHREATVTATERVVDDVVGTRALRALDGAWVAPVTLAEALANSTTASVYRSSKRLTVGQPPSSDELCAFGKALPTDLITIVIASDNRAARANDAIAQMCLPNAELVMGYPRVTREVDIPQTDRAKFGNNTFASLSLGEIAIHLSHRKALERCLQLRQAAGYFSSGDVNSGASGIASAAADGGCLILEDDFRLSGPRAAPRWAASYAALQAQPEPWHFLFVGRCMDGNCGKRDLRVSRTADLYQLPKRETGVGEPKWQFRIPMCLHAYMVTPAGAHRMLHALGTCPGVCPADWAPAVMADTSGIYTIAPALLTQSTTLRLSKDSGSVIGDGDLGRAGLQAQQGNTVRPPIVGECMARAFDETRLPESAQAPWFRTTGGANGPKVSTAVNMAFLGLEEAEAQQAAARGKGQVSVRTAAADEKAAEMFVGSPLPLASANMSSNDASTIIMADASNLSACIGLAERLSVGGARELFVDSAWQPGPEAVDAHVIGCALQFVATRAQTQAACDGERWRGLVSEAKSRRNRSDVSRSSSSPGYNLRCPFVIPAAQTAPRAIATKLSKVHCIASYAGFLDNESTSGGGDKPPRMGVETKRAMTAAAPRSADEVLFQETAGWPRPPACGWRTGPRMDYRVRNGAKRLYKLVNHKRELEFRPVLKAGSTMLRHLMSCLQPGEWNVTHQSVPMPANYTALVVVRDPVRRFTSSLTEVVRRVFAGVCPDGPCTGERDHYFTAGVLDSADDVARHASWYRHALRLYNGDGGGANRKQTVRELLAAAVTDASCLLDYYGAEHFMSQMQLASQGTALDGPPTEAVAFYRLEDISHDAAQLAASPLLAGIGAQHTPRADIEHCVRDANALAHNTGSDVGALSSGGVTSGFEALPGEAELYQALEKEDALLLSLCSVYAQDALCLSTQYKVPQVCRAVLEA